MRKVLILGVCGFAGRHFLEFMISNKLASHYSLLGVDVLSEGPGNIEYRRADLTAGGQVEEILLEFQPTYILNFIGILDNPEVRRIVDVNAGISLDILEVIRKHELPVKAVLLVGSAAEYGLRAELPIREDAATDPVTPYALSKVLQSRYAAYYWKNHRAPVIVARTFNLIGRHLPPAISLAAFLSRIRAVEEKGEIRVGNISARRDFLDIRDAVSAYWKILLQGRSGEVYNICRGLSTSMQDILEYMIRKSGKDILIKTDPSLIRVNDVLDSYGDNSRLKTETGWRPEKSVFEAVDEMLRED